jgi:hypothetical protein
MATNAECGTTGSVSLGGEVTQWTFNYNEEVLEATSMASSGAREYIACLKDGDGTWDTFVASGVVGAHGTVDFTNAKQTIQANIIVTSITLGTPVDNQVTYRYSFVTTGPIVLS